MEGLEAWAEGFFNTLLPTQENEEITSVVLAVLEKYRSRVVAKKAQAGDMVEFGNLGMLDAAVKAMSDEIDTADREKDYSRANENIYLIPRQSVMRLKDLANDILRYLR